MSKLFLAIFHGDVAELNRLVADGENLNQRDKYDRTPSEVAISRGHFHILEWLDEQGYNHYDHKDITAAIHGNRIDILKFLANHRCTFWYQDIYHAIRMGGLDVLKWLIHEGHCTLEPRILIWLISGAGLNLSKLGLGSTYTQCAAEAGQFEVLRWLIDDLHCTLNPTQLISVVMLQIHKNWEDMRFSFYTRFTPWYAKDHQIYKNYFDIIRWLVDEKHGILTNELIKEIVARAIETRQLGPLKWLIEGKYYSFTTEVSEAAVSIAAYDLHLDHLK